jgi:triosephosphate isomerase
LHAESDQVVADKAKAALAHRLVPIVCVGETLAEREAGQTESVVRRQLAAVVQTLGDAISQVVVAYEPVWAIGTGEVATPEDAQEVCAALRARLAELYPGDVADEVRVLYGGSVKAANVAGIMEQPDVDGALVGGASLDATEFAGVCRFAP